MEIAAQRSARRDAADASLAAQEKRTAVAKRQAVLDGYIAFFEASAAEEELGLAGELAALSGAIAAVARARAEQGVGSALDAEVAEASSLRVVRARLEAERRWAVAKSALTLRFGLDASAPAVVRGDLEPLDGVGGSRGATHDPSRRPEVEALEAERRALELRAETFRRARVPTPSVSAFLHNDGFNERVFGVGVAVPLPLPAPLGRTYACDIQDYADVKKTLFGASFIKDVTDYRYSPQRGYTLTVTFAAGKRKIEKNNAFNPELYDSLPLKSNEYKAEIAGDAYFKLMKKLILNVGVTGAKLQTENTFNNELFRFGGLKTLRGFDEESFNANTYIIGKTELRLLLDGNSYLFAFYNQAYYEQRSFDVKRSDTPLGFGAGLAFETKAGIFSFNYALGMQQNNPILFPSAKVHFGIVSAF